MNDIHQKHIWLVGKEILEGRVLGKTAVKWQVLIKDLLEKKNWRKKFHLRSGWW